MTFLPLDSKMKTFHYITFFCEKTRCTLKRTFSLNRYLEFICTTDMFTIHLISFSKKPQNRKVRKYLITSRQCVK